MLKTVDILYYKTTTTAYRYDLCKHHIVNIISLF